MSRDINDGSQWERVAAELRACREAQQRAWGDIDNTTLGRYLAGEVTTEEHEQIEQALNELPELRKLTDLVRDVLSETEATVEQPEAVPYRPATLPFPQPSMRAAGAGPVRVAGWKSRRLAPHLRQWVGLAAAACVLFVLGVAFPRSAGVSAPQTELALTMSQPVAMRDVSFSRAVLADDREMTGQLGALDRGEPFKREKFLVAQIDADLKTLQAEGHKHEAERLARQFADNLRRKALSYQEKGDLVRAEPALQEARQLCVRVWGLQAPETVRSSNSLAEVYEVALNVTPPNPYTPYSYAGGYSQNPYSGSGSGSPAYSAGTHDPVRAPFAFSMTAPAPPGDKLSAVQSSSSYEPGAARPRSAPPGAMAKKAPTKEAFRRSGQQAQVQAARMMANRSYPASTASLVALRDRLTSQSQSELKTSVVPVLTQALREANNSEERQRLARALGQLGPAARDAVPVLLDCCRQAKDTSERASMLLVLGEIGPTAAPEAVPILVQSLQTDSPTLRDCAARALVQLGPAARHDCRQELVEHSKDDPLVRSVLLRLDGPEGRCGINDESECFSVKVIQETRQEIHQLAATYRIAIGIETTPDKVVVKPTGKDRDGRLQGVWMFERQHMPATVEIQSPDKTRVRILGDRTVYFHINKDAADAHVFVSDALQKQGLSNAQLHHALKTHLSKKDYDGALREAIQVVARFEKDKSAKK